MSIATTRIHCTGCDYEYFENYQPITLHCRYGTEIIEYYRAISWCHDCNSIKYAEDLPTIEEIRQEYGELYGVPGPEVKGLKRLLQRFDRHHRERMRELEQKIAWRQARTTPPHCLSCGSDNLSQLDFVKKTANSAITETFRHSCGGAFIHDYGDKTGTRFHFAPEVILMDIDGHALVSATETER